MFFKPYKGICRCHNKERWILNKKGECNETIWNRKKTKGDRANDNSRSGNFFSNTRKGIQRNKNHERTKEIVKQPIPNKRIQKTPLTKKVKKATGEGQLFIQIWEEAVQEASPSCPSCRVCKEPLGFEPKVYFFSHLLAKSTYPSLRTYKPNIWICCYDCHHGWDHGDRSLPKFAAKRAEALRLKQLFYAKQIP